MSNPPVGISRFTAAIAAETAIMKPPPHESLRVGDQLPVAGHRADIADVRAKVVADQRG